MDKKISHFIAPDLIQTKILFIRGKKVMLDRDLAELYGVENRALKQSVKRNIERFPEDFMFFLNPAEVNLLVSQNVIPSHKVLGGHKVMAFTEHGILMLSSVLNSERAIFVNIQIMRTFAKLRELMQTHKELREKIEAMEKKYDHQFHIVFEAIKQLIDPPQPPKKQIGFHTTKTNEKE